MNLPPHHSKSNQLRGMKLCERKFKCECKYLSLIEQNLVFCNSCKPTKELKSKHLIFAEMLMVFIDVAICQQKE